MNSRISIAVGLAVLVVASVLAVLWAGCGPSGPQIITDTTSSMDGYVYLPSRTRQAGVDNQVVLSATRSSSLGDPVPDGTAVVLDSGQTATTTGGYYSLGSVPVGLRDLTVADTQDAPLGTFDNVCVGPRETTHGTTVPPTFHVVFTAPNGFFSPTKTCQLVANLYVNDAKSTAYEDFIWESSDESIATVDQGGLVTALAVGQTQITAKLGPETGAPSGSIPFTVTLSSTGE